MRRRKGNIRILMCMVRHSSIFAFCSVNLKEIRVIDEVQGEEAKACNPIGVLNGIGFCFEADKFWELCKRIREDRRCAGAQISI